MEFVVTWCYLETIDKRKTSVHVWHRNTFITNKHFWFVVHWIHGFGQFTDNGGSLCDLSRLHGDNKRGVGNAVRCTGANDLDGSLLISTEWPPLAIPLWQGARNAFDQTLIVLGIDFLFLSFLPNSWEHRPHGKAVCQLCQLTCNYPNWVNPSHEGVSTSKGAGRATAHREPLLSFVDLEWLRSKLIFQKKQQLEDRVELWDTCFTYASLGVCP